jgi:hypothetical protein
MDIPERHRRLAANAPITDVFDASKIITTMRGTSTTPLITALQNRAFIGRIGEYWITSRPARSRQ